MDLEAEGDVLEPLAGLGKVLERSSNGASTAVAGNEGTP